MSISRVYKIVNDIDDLVYIGSTTQKLCKRMSNHRERATKGYKMKVYNHMRYIGVEHFKIMCVREYKDISKERLKYKEDKYIKRFDTVRNGLNSCYAFGIKCEHNIFRKFCIECGGSQICPHNKQKQVCKECGGSQICLHNKNRSACKECGGSAFCSHNKQRQQCRECKGSALCLHNKQKQTCKECGGSQICLHNKRKSQCAICSPAVCDICSKVLAGYHSLKRHKNTVHSSLVAN